MRRTNSIPILLLTGFLGSGKTSLLNHLLSNKAGLKIGVIINDFGEINIDSMLVSAQTDTALELSNGCICCAVEGENLDDAIGQLAHTGSRLDYIVIEASGLAEPRELATMLRLIKNDYAYFDALVTIVDGLNFKKNNLAAKDALKDLAISDLIVVNKTDLIDTKQLAAIEKAISLAAPQARILKTAHGQVDFRLLLDLKEKPETQLNLTAQDTDHHDHLHAKFQSVTFQEEKPLDPAQFEAWAQALAPNIFRAKGIIFFGMKGMEQKFIFQAVGSRYALKLDEWGFGEQPMTSLVIIGLDLDKAKIETELRDLIDDNPEKHIRRHPDGYFQNINKR